MSASAETVEQSRPQELQPDSQPVQPTTPPSCSRSIILHALVDTANTRGDLDTIELQELAEQQLEPISAGDSRADNCDALPSPSAAHSGAHVDHAITPPRSHTPSVIIHAFDVYAPADLAHDIADSVATTGTASSAAAAATPAPSAAQWREELRSMWEAGAEAAANAAAAKRKQAQQLQAAQSRQERLPLSAAVQAQPPLQGDIVWHAKPARRVTVGTHKHSSTHVRIQCVSAPELIDFRAAVSPPLCRSVWIHRCPNTRTTSARRSCRTGASTG